MSSTDVLDFLVGVNTPSTALADREACARIGRNAREALLHIAAVTSCERARKIAHVALGIPVPPVLVNPAEVIE